MAAARTSISHPLQIAEVRPAPGMGRIGITFCPGKHDRAAASGAWARDLETDLDAITAWGARAVLTLVEPAELDLLRVPDLGPGVLARGMDWRHLPIADFSVPDEAFETRWLAEGPTLRALLRDGQDIVVHCRGGLGRAGMIAARLMAELGLPPDEAIRAVRKARPGAIETPSQLALVRRTEPVAEAAPLDTAALQRVSGRLGSTPGGVWQDAQGRRYYIKDLDSPALARNERLAAALYRLAGAPTLTDLPTRDPCQFATVLVTLDKTRLAQFTAAERAEARLWLGLHAWTANWDAVGDQGGNQGVLAGRVVTLDLGGALEFRAMGDPKGAAFGPVVTEVDRLRQDPANPHARDLFGDMTPAELAAALRRVTRLPEPAIRRTVLRSGGSPALADTLAARQADLARRLAALDDPA